MSTLGGGKWVHQKRTRLLIICVSETVTIGERGSKNLTILRKSYVHAPFSGLIFDVLGTLRE